MKVGIHTSLSGPQLAFATKDAGNGVLMWSRSRCCTPSIKRGIVADSSIYDQSKRMQTADLDIMHHPRVVDSIVRYQNTIVQPWSSTVLVSSDERHGFFTRTWHDSTLASATMGINLVVGGKSKVNKPPLSLSRLICSWWARGIQLPWLLGLWQMTSNCMKSPTWKRLLWG